MSKSVSECYSQMIDGFEHGIAHGQPDVLCASYFNTLRDQSSTPQPRCLHNTIKQLKDNSRIETEYDPATGVLTLTTAMKNSDRQEESQYGTPIIVTQSMYQAMLQAPFVRLFPSHCTSLEDLVTLTIPSWPSGVGHQTVLGDFGATGQLDTAISAPYHDKAGAVFIVNSTVQRSLSGTQQDLTKLTETVLAGKEGTFGWAMVTVDFNQDGVDDLAVACPTENGGQVFIYFGQQGIGLSEEPSVQIELPFQGTVLAAIDIDQDGHLDLVIGCPLCPSNDYLQVKKKKREKNKSICILHTTKPLIQVYFFSQGLCTFLKADVIMLQFLYNLTSPSRILIWIQPLTTILGKRFYL